MSPSATSPDEDDPSGATAAPETEARPQTATATATAPGVGRLPPTTTVDFDALLPHIGEMGRYQMYFYLLMCVPTMPAAFLAFNQVFLSAEPNHWCRVSAFDTAPGAASHNLTSAQRRALSIPRRGGRGGGGFGYSNCRQYDVNFTEVFLVNGGAWPDAPDPAWNTTPCREGWVYDRSEFKNTLVTEVSHEYWTKVH